MSEWLYCGFGAILNFFISRGEESYSPETLALFVKTVQENFVNGAIQKASFQTMRKAAHWIEEYLSTGQVSQQKLRKYNFACAPPEFENLLSQYQLYMDNENYLKEGSRQFYLSSVRTFFRTIATLGIFHPAENRKRDDYVFYAYGGPQRPMSPDTVAAFVKKYGESARHVCTSIPERVHPHMLRHTRAMHLYQDGVPLAMVSEFLGHAQIETTKIYAHADTEMKRKAIQQAANKLNDTIPDALWNTDDEEMMLKLRGKQQYK